MKKQSNTGSIVMYILSALFALLGIAQLILTLPTSIKTANEYLASGGDPAQVTEYYLSSVIPQVLGYIIAAFGIAAVLFSAAIICKKINICTAVSVDTVSETVLPEASIIETAADEDLGEMLADENEAETEDAEITETVSDGIED